MAKYMILFNSSAKAGEVMASSNPEDMKASMQEWIAWRDEAVKTVKFDFGMPLQVEMRITTSGEEESNNPASGYAMIEGEKEEIIRLLKTHPHLKMPGASIDLLEILPMPGM